VKRGVTNEASLRTAIRSVLLEGTSYTVKRGDSLSKIAQRVYGDPHRWPDIYDANRDVLGGNPNLIHPDTVITIPDSDVDDIGFKQTIGDLIAMNPDAIGPGRGEPTVVAEPTTPEEYAKRYPTSDVVAEPTTPEEYAKRYPTSDLGPSTRGIPMERPPTFGATPGHGSIDGMSPQAWLENYWASRPATGHRAKAAIDLKSYGSGGHPGILEIIKRSMLTGVDIFALDETQISGEGNPPPTITSDYVGAPGGASGPHYHVRVNSVEPRRVRLAEQVLEGQDWSDYIDVSRGVDMTLDSKTLDYLKILAALVKEAAQKGEYFTSGKPTVTSGFRGPARQTRAMTNNWNRNADKYSPAWATQYLVDVYADNSMAKAFGQGLEGYDVTTNQDMASLRVISATTAPPEVVAV